MKSRLDFAIVERASGCLPKACLALVLCMSAPSPVWAAAASEFDVNLAGYVARAFVALVLLGGLGVAAVKFLPGRFRSGSQGRLKLMGALNLGRDVVYLLRIGPDVVAVVAGKTGSTLLGRWRAEEWDDYEAALTERPKPFPAKEGP